MEDLSIFAIKKEVMNKLRGGVEQSCHCGVSHLEFVVYGDIYDELWEQFGQYCPGGNFACTPV